MLLSADDTNILVMPVTPLSDLLARECYQVNISVYHDLGPKIFIYYLWTITFSMDVPISSLWNTVPLYWIVLRAWIYAIGNPLTSSFSDLE